MLNQYTAKSNGLQGKDEAVFLKGLIFRLQRSRNRRMVRGRVDRCFRFRPDPPKLQHSMRNWGRNRLPPVLVFSKPRVTVSQVFLPTSFQKEVGSKTKGSSISAASMFHRARFSTQIDMQANQVRPFPSSSSSHPSPSCSSFSVRALMPRAWF